MNSEQPVRDRSLELEDVLLLAPVLLLPWAFGGVEIWAYRGAALPLVAAACVCLWKRGWDGLGLRRGSGWLLPALLLGAWAAVQLAPLPPAAIRLLSPEAHRLYANALPGYDGPPVEDPLRFMEQRALDRVEEATAWPPPEEPAAVPRLEAPGCFSRRWRTLSLVPSATGERLAWYVALLLGFLVLRERVRDPLRFRAYRRALFAMFGALALFSLVQLALGNGRIYWVRRVLVHANPLGPYVNPTNLAGVMELGVPAMVGYAWYRLRRNGRAALYEAGFGASVAAAVFCLVAGFASASKMGVLLICVGLVALALLSARTLRARLAVIVISVVLASAAALVLSGTRLGERVDLFVKRSQEIQLLEGRIGVWQAGFDMYRDFPLAGSGFGSFREVFARYVPAGEMFRWDHAHNDYVELLLEGGTVAATLVLWLLVGYARRLGRSLRASAPASPARLGLLVGVAALAVHALFDFNHQVPANALVWVACCGLLLPATLRRGEGDTG